MLDSVLRHECLVSWSSSISNFKMCYINSSRLKEHNFIVNYRFWINPESAKRVDFKVQRGLFLFASTNSCMNPIVYGIFNIRTHRSIRTNGCVPTNSGRPSYPTDIRLPALTLSLRSVEWHRLKCSPERVSRWPVMTAPILYVHQNINKWKRQIRTTARLCNFFKHYLCPHCSSHTIYYIKFTTSLFLFFILCKENVDQFHWRVTEKTF